MYDRDDYTTRMERPNTVGLTLRRCLAIRTELRRCHVCYGSDPFLVNQAHPRLKNAQRILAMLRRNGKSAMS